MTIPNSDLSRLTAEIVALDQAGRAFGVCATAPDCEPVWAFFLGANAGMRAYDYASNTFADLKSGRMRPGADREIARAMLAIAG